MTRPSRRHNRHAAACWLRRRPHAENRTHAPHWNHSARNIAKCSAGRQCSWIRDLTEEGIEPHPGPRYITKNINGFNDPKRRDTLWRTINLENKKQQIKAIYIQEHHMKKTTAETAEKEARSYRILFIAAAIRQTDTKGGTAIAVPYESIELRPKETISAAVERIKRTAYRSQGGRITALSMWSEGHRLRHVCAYAHADSEAAQRPHFFTNVLGPKLSKNTILALDANCVPDESLDLKRIGAAQYNNKGATELTNATAAHGLIDVTRECIGNEPFFTCHTQVPGGITKTRIDRIYMPDIQGLIWSHANGLHDFFPKPPNDSSLGHHAVTIAVEGAEGERGADITRINEDIYDDPHVLRSLHEYIKFTQKELVTVKKKSWSATWKIIKTQLRYLSLQFEKEKRYKDTKAIKDLKAARDLLKTQIERGEASAAEHAEYERTAIAIAKATKTQRALYETLEDEAWNRGKHHDTGTSAMYRPYKPKGAAHWVTSMRSADWSDIYNPIFGPVIRAPAQIAATVTEYWQALYTHRPTPPHKKHSLDKCLRLLEEGKQIQHPTAKMCDTELTLAEIIAVMENLPTGKSPGPDALPNKLYKVLSKTLAPIIQQVANESRQRGSYPEGMSDGIIATLYKKGDRDDPRNYRPITLLNGDYKIIMRALTRRMNEAVVQFVSDAQTGFVPDAFLAENIMLLKLLQTHLEDENEDAMFIFLDMEKAFDRCSWTYLMEAMPKLGFGEGFINFIKLAYNFDTPPQRQMGVNGYLGPKFSLTSGVAQGCPISPLLFLIVTESLSRLFESDEHIKGVRVNDIRHLISQFADDTTLMLSKGDDERAEAHLQTWFDATSMAENKSKREGMLIGPWNTNRATAPTNIVPKWLDDGTSIRALGCPMGNFDTEAWYLTRYRKVKDRIGQWPSIRRHSITARNMLLQAILYGSFRFWLYFMPMPDSISELIEEDAKQILWATDPELHTDELGSQKSKRWIHERASYLPTRKGGAGIMHFKSHCEAFYAHWIIRLLHPRRAPWKQIVLYWTEDIEQMKATYLLPSRAQEYVEQDIPPNAHYLRRCFNAFFKINFVQNTNILDNAFQAENLWSNHRMTIPLEDDRIRFWQNELQVTTVGSLLDHHAQPIPNDQWEDYFYQASPDGLFNHETAYNEWEEQLFEELQTIHEALPEGALDQIHPTTPTEGTVAIVGDNQYTRYAHHANGTYELLWLDISNRPHRTGQFLTPHHSDIIDSVEYWHTQAPDNDSDDDDGEDENANPHAIPKLPHPIIGPTHLTFPRNTGWHPAGSPATTEHNQPYSLADHTIKRITKLFTEPHCVGQQPNCIANWNAHLGQAIAATIPWPKVFASFGTPLSDPSDERQWRKLVHRATFVRNRNPKLQPQDQNCRLCRRTPERIHHMFECCHTAPLWRACIKFTTDVLHHDPPLDSRNAIIFGVWSSGKLGPPDARAFLRHAYGQFYHDFSNVDLKHTHFTWQLTFYNAILSFRDAVLRYAVRLHRLHTSRAHTTLTDTAPQDTYTKFNNIITIDKSGTHKLSDEFENAIAQAKAQADTAGRHHDTHNAPHRT